MPRYLVIPLLFLACTPSNAKTDSQQEKSPSAVDSLTLERSACYGTCPAYRLRLSSAGEIRFESRNPGENDRAGLDTATAATLDSLASRARSIGFFELPREIAADTALCHNRATDNPTVVVTIFTKAQVKRVEDYHGCFEAGARGIPSRLRPLRSFESEVDSVLRSSRWVRPASRR